MGKIEDLEKLQKLKENKIITNEEFEIEKSKILNDTKDNNKQSNSPIKIKFSYIVGIFVILALIIVIYLYIPKTVEVPNLIGMTVEEAKEITEDLGLNLRLNSNGDNNEIIEEQFGPTGEVEKDTNIYAVTKEYNKKKEQNITTNNKYITLDEFNKVQTGMTYQQVVEIIGGEGNLITEDSYGSKSYSWEPAPNSGMTTVVMGFTNGVLVTKMKV